MFSLGNGDLASMLIRVLRGVLPTAELELPSSLSSGLPVSTAVKNRTCPVCPWAEAVTSKGVCIDAVFKAMSGKGNVKTTPALVPIHSSSLHVNNAVTRKQANLCCFMIASDPESKRDRDQD